MSTNPLRTTGTDEEMAIGTPDSRGHADPLLIGDGARLRSRTVLYDGSIIWRRLQTGHGVVVREGCL